MPSFPIRSWSASSNSSLATKSSSCTTKHNTVVVQLQPVSFLFLVWLPHVIRPDERRYQNLINHYSTFKTITSTIMMISICCISMAIHLQTFVMHNQEINVKALFRWEVGVPSLCQQPMGLRTLLWFSLLRHRRAVWWQRCKMGDLGSFLPHLCSQRRLGRPKVNGGKCRWQ